MPSPLKVFGQRIRQLREQQNLSQEDFAELCNLHRTYIGGIERGERNIGLLNILYIAQALNVPPSELFNDFNSKVMATLPEK
jgi:transcriptional regulator with XRE-family HTH domain